MSIELIVQNIVTAILLSGFAIFVVVKVKNRRKPRTPLNDGDKVALLKTGRLQKNSSLVWQKGSQSTGGTLTLRERSINIRWGFGLGNHDVPYDSVRHLRLEPFGLSAIIVFEVADAPHDWALWIGKNQVLPLLTFLANKGVDIPADQR